MQRAGASLRVLVAPGWLYRGPSLQQVEIAANHLRITMVAKHIPPISCEISPAARMSRTMEGGAAPPGM